MQNLNNISQLTLGERYGISQLNEQGRSASEIGRKLGRNRSTVSRELKRNADGRSGRYRAELAAKKAGAGHREKNKRKAFTPQIRAYVADLLEKDHCPEQIAGLALRNGTPVYP